MALEVEDATTLYRRLLGRLTLAGGNVSAQWIAQNTRALMQQMDPNQDNPWFDYLNVGRQVWRDWVAGQVLMQRNWSPAEWGQVPTDPTIPQGGAPFRVRVLVTVTGADGTARSTLVPVDTFGTTTAEQLISEAIARVQAMAGTVNVPPPVFARMPAGIPPTGVIVTVGRQRDY